MLVHYKHLTKYAHSPSKAHAADACYDLRASSELNISPNRQSAQSWLSVYLPDTLVGREEREALDLLAIDTETTGVGWHDEAFMISVATQSGSHVYDMRECEHVDWHSHVQHVYDLLINCDKIIMHNAKFDIQKLCRLGIPLSVFKDKFEDTQALAHLIDEQQSTSLKYLARTVLNEGTDEDEVLKVWRRENKIKKEEGYEPIPNEILAPYAAKDAEFTLRLYEVLWNRMPKDLLPLYKIEKDLTLSSAGHRSKRHGYQ
jgi:DNA polymerase I-like protein with 3'-5' exonuclease and polymerase domains